MPPKIIGFTGNMGCGKSTAINILSESYKGTTNVKFAQPLYDIQEYIYRVVSPVYKRDKTFIKDRKLLQWIGTEWGRNTISETLWTDLWKREVNYILDNFPHIQAVVCDDVRFDNEAKIIKELGGSIIKIVSDKADSRINTKSGIVAHASEAGISMKHISYVVDNNGTIEAFRKNLIQVYKEILGN